MKTDRHEAITIILAAAGQATEERPYLLDRSVAHLRALGFLVERQEFPPHPMPGLWLVNGRELTEMQIIDLAGKTQ